ncbi:MULTISPECIES: hypothetical protein [Rhodanobacter]|uniref:Copper-binding protein n=1 Tax=Rhodanobacter denitrificans TaxID=666685 RepID=M4NFP1_9GAMM|nr:MULTISPECIES: hypothetical protein [Rhodanobacter]AGG88438.1 hypothetical protein R2APBS1_1286 [Rhodanobacter denitrificans]KZC21513.1 hypothetical protein RHOFW104R3_20840 [Rhodanobacter denitrificans]UJJ58892.1 hypothetical protein LRK55_01775 [Rhodanobacter denitrificans]UJM87575.1 hypothetical protein LRJ86_04505 [Rhodanobacter denitrificans]UJM95078.1 hypothetical protein LRK32_06490 [Rhodanobacter denitrificans]
MTFSPKIIVSTATLGLCLAFGTASAQDSGSMAPAPASSSMGQMGGMHHKMMRHNKNGSMHMMPATVSSVDSKTGIVEVSSAGMSLRVHFPPASVANLKAGDKITLHMGYTQ